MSIPKQPLSELGLLILTWMGRHGLNKKQAAAAFGLTGPGLTKIMEAGANPRSDTIERLAQQLGERQERLRELMKHATQVEGNVAKNSINPHALIVDEQFRTIRSLLAASENERAILELNALLDLLRPLGTEWDEKRCLCHLGLARCEYVLHPGLNRLPIIEKHYTSAILFAERLGLAGSLAQAYRGLANCHAKKLQIFEAEELYKKALVTAPTDMTVKKLALEGLAILSAVCCKWEQAIEIYEESLLIKDESDDREFSFKFFSIWANLGYCYINSGDYYTAQYYLEQIIKFAISHTSQGRKAEALFRLGLNEEKNGTIEKAQIYYQQSLVITETGEALLGLVRTRTGNFNATNRVAAQRAFKIFQADTFEPLQDLSLEWVTLIKMNIPGAFEEAQGWVSKIDRTLPSSVNYWVNPERKQLLQLLNN